MTKQRERVRRRNIERGGGGERREVSWRTKEERERKKGYQREGVRGELERKGRKGGEL